MLINFYVKYCVLFVVNLFLAMLLVSAYNKDLSEYEDRYNKSIDKLYEIQVNKVLNCEEFPDNIKDLEKTIEIYKGDLRSKRSGQSSDFVFSAIFLLFSLVFTISNLKEDVIETFGK